MIFFRVPYQVSKLYHNFQEGKYKNTVVNYKNSVMMSVFLYHSGILPVILSSFYSISYCFVVIFIIFALCRNFNAPNYNKTVIFPLFTIITFLSFNIVHFSLSYFRYFCPSSTISSGR